MNYTPDWFGLRDVQHSSFIICATLPSLSQRCRFCSFWDIQPAGSLVKHLPGWFSGFTSPPQNGSVLKLELMDNLVMLFSATLTYIRAIRYRVEETSGELCRTANQTLFSHTIFLQNEWKGYRVFLCSSLRIDVRKPKSEGMKVDLIKLCFWYILPLRAFFPDIKVNNNLCPHFLPVPVNSGWDLNCKSTLFLPQIWFCEVFSFSWPVDISVVTSWILVLQIFILRYRLDCCL